MKQFLIIPLGGLGSRFIEAGYKTYKPFLKISKKSRIIDEIINNFPISKTHVIILGNKKKYTYISKNLKKKKTSLPIQKHAKNHGKNKTIKKNIIFGGIPGGLPWPAQPPDLWLS